MDKEGMNLKSNVTQWNTLYIPFLSLLLSFLALRVLSFGRVEEVAIDEDCLKK